MVGNAPAPRRCIRIHKRAGALPTRSNLAVRQRGQNRERMVADHARRTTRFCPPTAGSPPSRAVPSNNVAGADQDSPIELALVKKIFAPGKPFDLAAMFTECSIGPQSIAFRKMIVERFAGNTKA